MVEGVSEGGGGGVVEGGFEDVWEFGEEVRRWRGGGDVGYEGY